MADLTIKISGDIANYSKALEEAGAKTESLTGQLESISKTAGVAFAVLTAEIGESVKAFGQSEIANNKLVQAMQNQGVYSDELAASYKEQALELSQLSGISADAITKAQAYLQSMIGDKEVTTEMTQAMLDLSAAKGMDLESTASLIGKGIEGHVAALQKLGITIDANLDKEQRTAQILDLINQKFGDSAESANKGLGGIKGLGVAFEEVQKSIGERFAPAIEVAISGLTHFFQAIAENKNLVDAIVSFIAAGAAVSGISLALGLAGMAWTSYTAFMAAAGVATDAVTLATRALVGATGLGLLIFGISELYLNWSSVYPKMQSVYEAFVGNISDLSAGLGKILSGVFSMDVGKIQEGFAEAKGAVKAGYDDIDMTATNAHTKMSTEEKKQDADKLALATAQNAKELALEKAKQAAFAAERDVEVAKAKQSSSELINLKQQEADTLKAIANTANASILGDLQKHLADLKAADDQANINEIAAKRDLADKLLANNEAYQNLNSSEQALFLQKYGQALLNSQVTEESAAAEYAQIKLAQEQANNNTMLIEKKQFGAAYAELNKGMHSDVAQGTESALSNMSQMMSSKNKVLFEIGKAAAVGDIGIKTIQSAMAIFAGFSTIPIVGQVLGIAGAAAAGVFGAEKMAETAAKQWAPGMAMGGLVMGGIPGLDSVPASLMPGELVVPQQNFEEVVGAVKTSRNNNQGGSSSDRQDQRGVKVTIGFDNRLAARLLTILQIQDTALGISPQGA